MFQADMAEKKTKKVDIQDLHPDVVAEMLQFIYSGNTPNLNRSAVSLVTRVSRPHTKVHIKVRNHGKAATSTFTLKILLRHYAKRTFTPR